MRRRLVRDVVLAASGVGIVGVYGNVLYNRAIDTLSEEAMAPYRIAEWMEKEAAAKTEQLARSIMQNWTQMIADHIRGKDQDEINALRQQIQAIIAERTSENQHRKEAWSRREKEVLQSVNCAPIASTIIKFNMAVRWVQVENRSCCGTRSQRGFCRTATTHHSL